MTNSVFDGIYRIGLAVNSHKKVKHLLQTLRLLEKKHEIIIGPTFVVRVDLKRVVSIATKGRYD